MRILERKEPKSFWPAVAECKNCKSTLEVQEDDCTDMKDRDKTVLLFECPVCKRDNYIQPR